MPKKIFDNYHLSVYKTKRGFIYAERRGINSTACLCYRINQDKTYNFLVRYQPLPLIKNENFKDIDVNLFPCCITGSIEKNETPETNAIKEIEEEAGYKITNKNIVDQIAATSTTQMNEIVHHFLVDLTNLTNETSDLGDGSFFESISVNKWISEKELQNIIFNNSELFLSSLNVCYCLFLKHFKHKNKS